MDDIYKLRLTNLFIEIGLLVIKKFKIPHSALQVYYNGISNEEGGLQPLLLLITINSFCNTYFYL